jgi:uncharacterized protein (TIGR00290 family)
LVTTVAPRDVILYLAFMPYALMTSGGKDSTLALDRALRNGLDVRLLLNIYDRASGRVRFHGVRRELIEEQARALGLAAVTAPTTPEAFEAVFLDLLTKLKARGITGVIFGNIHLEEVRAWYERRVRAAGLEHREPLWGEQPLALFREVVGRGFRTLIVRGDLTLGAADMVGRGLDQETLRDITSRPDIDPCGEHGEFHTFVFDGPIFAQPVPFERGKLVVIEGHRFLDLIPVAEPAGAA